jgi:hypothetical protein
VGFESDFVAGVAAGAEGAGVEGTGAESDFGLVLCSFFGVA